MKSNLDRGYFQEPESPPARWRPTALASALALLFAGALAGSAVQCYQSDLRYPATFTANESAGRIWQLLDSDQAATSEIRGHAMNICAKAEQAIADLATIAGRAPEPLRGQFSDMIGRIRSKAEEAAAALQKEK